jgi:hypothetical protein
MLRVTLVLWLVALFLTPIAKGAEQTLSLRQGWNLISFWLQPSIPGVNRVFEGLPAGRLQRVFGFDGNAGSAGEWKCCITGLAPDKAWLNTLTEIEPGLGYWVLLSNGPSVDMIVSGVITTQGSKILRKGWHLIGLGNQETRAWHDVFGPAASSVGALFTFDSKTNQFVGFEDPGFDNIDVNGDGTVDDTEFGWLYGTKYGELPNVEPGAAYWVHLNQDTVIGPVLEIEMENDIDALPSSEGADNIWNPHGEDTDINGNGLLDYGYTVAGALDNYGNPIINTQDTVWFRIPKGSSHPLMITRQLLTIANMGSGALLFEVESTFPWLKVEPTSGEVIAGEASFPVTLTIDRQGFSEGEINETLTVRSNGGVRQVKVRISVPGIRGQYAGSIIITNVSGKKLYLGRWPVLIGFGDGFATIHSEGSPHFSADVELTGSIANGSFDLTGQISVPINEPLNPYGTPFTRSIFLTGGWIQRDNAFGAQLGLKGAYEESIAGLGTGPIQMSGQLNLLPKTQ